MLEVKESKKYGEDIHLKFYNDDEYCGDLIYRYTLSDNVYIRMIRVLKKFRRRGIARKIILFVDELYPMAEYIGGSSKPNSEAMGFWKSMGAEFVGDWEELLEKQELIPFGIFKINR